MGEKQLIGVGIGLAWGFLEKKFFNGSKWYRPNIPNNMIPYINTTIGAAVGAAVPDVGAVSGTIAGLASVGAHQTIKIPTKAATGKSI